MLPEILMAAQLVLLAYFAFFGFYNFYYSIASLLTPKLKRVKRSGKKVAVVIVSFNERTVLKDTIECCERLSYPNKTIIVADDSSDPRTYELLRSMAEQRGAKRVTASDAVNLTTTQVFESPGFVLFHRRYNAGFKGGCLKLLAPYLQARGFEYMYLIDADWRPQKDAVERCLEVLEADPKLAFVQAEHEYQDEKMPFLQRCLAINEEGAYFADLAGRQVVGDAILFTGCCTLFRLSALEKVNGFTHGHLTEDIDLTNRLYLAGYKAAYLENVRNEGEVPPRYAAYRRQQEHWAMGTARVFKEHTLPILRSGKLKLREKLSLLRQSAYYTPAIAIEASMLLALASVLLIALGGTESFDAVQYRYYLQQIGQPYSMILFLCLASSFAPLVVTAIKRKSYANLFFMPYALWVSWSIVHTYLIANLKGLLNTLQDWYHTPKHNRKKRNIRLQEHRHIRIGNLATLLALMTLYALEYYVLGWLDVYAFFWVPALVIGIMLE